MATPSEARPDFGTVCLWGEPISQAKRFVDEHGTWVIRSREFDVYGQGDTFEVALGNFVTHASDYYEYIAEVARDGGLAESELLSALKLGERLVAAGRKMSEHVEGRNLVQALYETAVKSRRQGGQRNWRSDHRQTSSEPLPV